MAESAELAGGHELAGPPSQVLECWFGKQWRDTAGNYETRQQMHESSHSQLTVTKDRYLQAASQ